MIGRNNNQNKLKVLPDFAREASRKVSGFIADFPSLLPEHLDFGIRKAGCF